MFILNNIKMKINICSLQKFFKLHLFIKKQKRIQSFFPKLHKLHKK
jgi:hypothetical protein